MSPYTWWHNNGRNGIEKLWLQDREFRWCRDGVSCQVLACSQARVCMPLKRESGGVLA